VSRKPLAGQIEVLVRFWFDKIFSVKSDTTELLEKALKLPVEARAALAGFLIEYPEGGTPYFEGTRRYLMQRFPFSVVYRQKRRTLQIVAVAHSKRKPGYWKVRVEH
jgi:hypothetical protein